jgi:integrase
MPKRARELTARMVAALKEEGRYAVGGVAGLQLRIEGHSRSWVLRIAIGGKRRDLGLGPYPLISLAVARREALKRHVAAITTARSGDLPNFEIRQPVEPTPRIKANEPYEIFEVAARTYIDAQTSGWKSQKHASQWLSTLSTYAFPTIGALHVSEVSASLVLQILKPIWISKTETATRLRARIENILDWAKHRKYFHGDNPARWEGNLEHELPPAAKLIQRKRRHHPALPYTRIGVFMVDLRLREGVAARALEWGILTASRFQEIAGARRNEIDLDLKRWTVPAGRMKRGIEHVVPLSEEAIEVFTKLPRENDSDLLFPSALGGQLSNAAMGALIDGMHSTDITNGGRGYLDPRELRVATQHGFRSTFRDWAGEVAHFEREVVEHALAHKLKDRSEAAYQRGTLLMKRAVMMKQWARFCGMPVYLAPPDNGAETLRNA